MKSKVILFCVLLFCSKIVDANPHSEDIRHRVKPSLNWQVDQNTQDSQFLDTDFRQTRNVNPMAIPVIQQDSIQDYGSNQERYTSTYDGYGYDKSPVASPSGKPLLSNYNSQIDGRRLESYPPRVESYPPQVGFDSQQLRNPNWRSQNPYTNSGPSGVLITDSERPLVNTVQESYRAPVQYPQPNYVPSSNRGFYPPNRPYLRSQQFKNPLADDAGDGTYVANSAHRFGSSGPVPYENFSEGQAGASDIKTRGGQRYLQKPSQSGNLYNEVPAVIGDTLAAQSENIKFLENYNSDLTNTGPSINYDGGAPVMSEVENYSLDSRSSHSPVSYESYNNGQATASDVTARLTSSRRQTQGLALQSGVGYKESPAVISTDALEDQRIDRSRSDLSNAAHITNYNDDFSPDKYSPGSRLSNVRVPYEIYGESQASKVKLKSIGDRKYTQNIAPQSRLMYNNIPAVIATDIVADQSKTIRENENREKYILRSDSGYIVPATNQEDSSTVISAADNTNTDSRVSNPSPENIEKKTPIDFSQILSSAHRHAHNSRTESESNKIVRDDSYNSASNVISETVEEKSGEKPVPINTFSETSSTSTDTETDVPARGSNTLIPSKTNVNHLKNHKPPSGISELSLIDLLSKTDVEKFMAGNTKRFLVIHPNKTVEYVDNIEADSHQNSKVRLLNTKPKNVVDSEANGAPLLENVKDNPVDGSDSNLPIEDLAESQSNLKPLRPHIKQQAGSGSLKPVTPISKPLTPLVNQATDDDTPFKPLTLPENIYPVENKYSKRLRPNTRHHVHRYESKATQVNQPAFDNKLNPSFPDGNQLAVDNKLKAQNLNENLPRDENDSDSSSPNENQPSNDNNAKTLSSKEKKSLDDNDFIPSSPRKRWLGHNYNSKLSHKYQPTYEYNSKPLSPNENQPENENNSKSLTLNGNQSGGDSVSNSLSPNEDQSGNDKIPKKLFMNENQPEDDVDTKTPGSYKRHHKSKPLRIKQSFNVDNSNPSYPDQNQPSDEEKPLYPYKTQPIQGNQPDIENNPKRQLPNENQPGDENDSNSSSPNENQPSNDNNAKTLSLKENKSVDDNKLPHKYQPTYKYNSNPASPNENLPENENNSESSTLNGNQSGDDSDSNPLSPDEDQSGNDKISKKMLIDENQSDDNVVPKISRSHKSIAAYVDNFNPSYPEQNQPPDNQLGDENDSNTSSPSKNQPEDENDSNLSSPSENQQGDDNDSNSSSPSKNQPVDDSNSNLPSSEENQPEDINMSNPSYVEEPESSNASQSEDADTLPENNTEDDNNSNSLTPDENHLKDDSNDNLSGGKSKNSNPLQPRKRKHKNKRKRYENQSENDDTSPENIPGDDKISDSSSPDENEPEDKKKSKRLRPFEKQPNDDLKPDENPDTTTVSPTAPNYTELPKLQVARKHKHRPNRRKSTTSSPIVTSTTLRLEEPSEEIITISPIEQVTDNMRGVSPATTSTTTAKPIETPVKSDAIKDDNDEQDDNNLNSSSGDLDTISTPTKNNEASGDKTTKKTIENKNIQTNDKGVKSQLSKDKKDIQTVQSAVYNSSELLNTDVPAESDIYSPVTTSPSVQNDVNTGDASGDNTLELEQPETDVTITVSNNTDNDSEDDVIIIIVEVSESTGSSGNDKSLLISIDTNDDSDDEGDDDIDDDSKASQATDVAGHSSDCKKDHNDDEGKGKNLEIDMSNMKGEPTMWIRTTNQDFIEKLTEKNDTAFDIVYFFNMVTQPVIEKEKETTFYCNGTVVITIKETTYPNKEDSTPTVEKKMQIMQIEDYKRNVQKESSD